MSYRKRMAGFGESSRIRGASGSTASGSNQEDFNTGMGDWGPCLPDDVEPDKDSLEERIKQARKELEAKLAKLGKKA